MSERPSDGWEFDELRDEFDWMFEFNSRMAERIRKDPDVHNLASYVSKLEQENAELRELCADLYECNQAASCDECEYAIKPFGCEILRASGSFTDRIHKLGIEVGG